MSDAPRVVTVLLVGRSAREAEPLRGAFAAALGADLTFETASDVATARARLETAAVDAVVVDLSGPGASTQVVARLVPLAGDATVIVLVKQREAAIEAMRFGAQDYLLTSALAPIAVEMTLRFAAERARTLRALRHSEEAAQHARSLLAATLDATTEGVLVVDLQGRVTAHNRRFAEMWQVPEAALASGNLQAVRSHMTPLMRQPEAALAHLREGQATADLPTHDVIELRDGRAIERHSRPQRLGDRVVGRVLGYRDITQQRAAAASLQREHDLRTAIIESSGEAIFAKDLEGRYLLMNSFAAELLGLEAAAVSGRRDDDLFAPGRAQRFREVDRRVIDTGEAVVEEAAVERPNGPVYLLVRKGPLRDRQGRVVGVLGMARDISDRRRAEQAIRSSEERYRAFIAQSTEAVWRIEFEEPVPIDLSEEELLDRVYATGYLAECNDTMARLYGRASSAELIGTRMPEILSRAEPQNEAVLRTLLRSGFRLTDVETRERSGQLRIFINNIVGVVEDGRLVRAWGTQRDVTARKRGEVIQAATYQISEAANTADHLEDLLPEIHRIVNRLIRADNFYVALLSDDGRQLTFPYYVDEADPDFSPKPLGRGLTEYVLRTGEPLLATPEEWERLLERREVELVGPPSIDWLGVPLTTGDRVFGVLAVQSYDETTRYDEHAKRMLLFVAEQVANAIERLRSAAALRAAEERYRAFIEQSTEGVSRIEHDPPVAFEGRPLADVVADLYATGYVAECNDAMAQMYGFPRAADLVGRRIAELHDRADPVNEEIMAEFVRDGFRLVDGESHERNRDGQIRVFLKNMVGFVEQGRLVRAWGTQRDVTQQRLLEEQLRQAQKLEAVGRLAGGIAHDFNNILTAILGTSDLMLGELPDPHPTREDVAEIRRAALRAAELTRQLLAYSRRQVRSPRHVDLNVAVRGLDTMLRRLIGEDVELTLSLEENLAAVLADPSQLEQVLLNLAVNSRDAMPGGGLLHVSTATVDLAPGDPRAPGAAPGRYVELAVIDTGTGMTPAVRAHLFEPFFTTKEVGKGTGLGLATVYGIVQQSGGHIVVDTAPERGTTMRIFFPATPSPASEGPAAALPAAPRATGQLVLIVEDERAVRAFARRALEGAGYRVLTAPDGPAALALAETHSGGIDLLLTDVVMPGMNGRQLAARLTERLPDLAVLFMTGYADDAVFHTDGSIRILQKPFDADTLLRRVRETIEGRAPTPRA